MSGAGDGPVAAETPSQPALDENKHTPARSCSPMWRSFLEEPPLTTRKEAVSVLPSPELGSVETHSALGEKLHQAHQNSAAN